MLILGINWYSNSVFISTSTGRYTCVMEERDDGFYFKFKNKWHRVLDYSPENLRAEILSHKQGVYPDRNSISQGEFERICKQVLSEYPEIIRYSFEYPGILHVSYPSHSGRSVNGAMLNYGSKGYITYVGWEYSTGSNKGYFIGKEISKRIHSAMYD